MTDQDKTPTEPEDTEGHRAHGYSDRTLKEDVQPVDHGDDTEGHRAHGYSDRTLKEDVQPVDHEDDVEDHRSRP